MPYANPQATGLSDAASASSIPITLASPIAIGELVVLDVAWGSSTLTASLVDNLGNAYFPVAAAGVDGTNNQSAQMFFTIATVAGTPTITASFKSGVTLTAVPFRAINAGHYTSPSGFAFDVGSIALKATSTTPTSSAVTATSDNSLVVGSCTDTSASAVPSAGAGMTLTQQVGDGSTNVGMVSAWKTLVPAVSVTTNFTFAATQASVVSIAVFKPLLLAPIYAPAVAVSQRRG